MKQPLRLDYLWAGMCLAGAAYFNVPGRGSARIVYYFPVDKAF
jgi:hypothetical protein